LRKAYTEGIAWGDAKHLLLERIDQEIAPMRARYQHLMEHPQEVEALLLAGAQKARAIAIPFMARLRQAVGLRSLTTGVVQAKAKAAKSSLPSFKQYREKDGKFYFKLADAKGVVLLQSLGLESPQLAGKSIGLLQMEGATALDALAAQLEPVADRNAVLDALDAMKVATD
jgi:tryptophanyl-tRNA synthetase